MMSPPQILMLRTKLEILKDIIEDDIKLIHSTEIKEIKSEFSLIRKQRLLNKVKAAIGTINYIMGG